MLLHEFVSLVERSEKQVNGSSSKVVEELDRAHQILSGCLKSYPDHAELKSLVGQVAQVRKGFVATGTPALMPSSIPEHGNVTDLGTGELGEIDDPSNNFDAGDTPSANAPPPPSGRPLPDVGGDADAVIPGVAKSADTDDDYVVVDS